MSYNLDVMSEAAKGHIFVNVFKLIRGTMPFLADVLNLTPLFNAIRNARREDVPVMKGLH